MSEEPLDSEQVILSSPMSFSGSAKRSWRLTSLTTNQVLKVLLAILAISIIAIWWSAVLAWYVVFGIFLVPWRLFRRGQRKDKKRELQHREVLSAMKNRDD